MAKKTTKKKPPPGSAEGLDALRANLTKAAKSDRMARMAGGTFTGSDILGRYRYIDFCDPLTGLPCLVLEWLFGARGFVAGRMVKIEAEEAVGKSAFCFLMYAMAQAANNAWTVHMDAEQTPPPADYITRYGVDYQRLLFNQPDSVIKAFQNILTLLEQFRGSGVMKYSEAEETSAMAAKANKVKGLDEERASPIVLGVDSISGLSADDTEDADFGGNSLGLHAREVSRFFRDHTKVLERTHTLLLMVQQIKAVINTGYGEVGIRQRDSGGIADKPLNFHASYRLRLSRVRVGAHVPGVPPLYGAKIRVTKNKMSKSGLEATIPFFPDGGFNLHDASVDWLFGLGEITLPCGDKLKASAAGGHAKCELLSDTSFGQGSSGKRKLYAALVQDSELLMQLRAAMRIRGYGLPFETEVTAKTVAYDPAAVLASDPVGPDE